MVEKAESEKFSHVMVRYVEKSAQMFERCGNCEHFLAPDACTGVKKPIVRPGWCVRYDRKEK
jgi:hypothetical protein